MSLIGCDGLVAALRSRGVEVVWGVPGAHNLPAWRAVQGAGFHLVTTRHEAGAGYAADGYARATGRAGVTLVTTGPGATNALTAVGEAYASSVPLLLIATDVPTSASQGGINRGALHQSSSQRTMFQPVTKAQFRVEDSESLGRVAALALDACLAAPARPVYLEVPADVWLAPIAGTSINVPPRVPSELSVPLETELVAAQLLSATRPLLWAGAGAVLAEAQPELLEVAERLAAPVLTTFRARGLVPPHHPCSVGFAPHFRAVGRLWDYADCVLSIGSDFDGMMTQDWRMPAPPTLLAINIDEADAAKNYRPEAILHGDAKVVLRELARLVSSAPRRDLSQLRAELDLVRAQVLSEIRDFSEEASVLLDVLAAATSATNSGVVCDMCVAGYWAAAALTISSLNAFAYPVGWGTLGYAVGASLGMARGTGRPTLCIVGDGGLMMSCGDLATIAEERAPVTILVVDDGGYGMLRRSSEEFRLHTPDFVALFSSFGIPCLGPIDSVADLARPLSEALSSAKPSAVHIRLELPAPPTTTPHWYRVRTN